MDMPEKKHNPFKLKDFWGVDPAACEIMAAQGIKTTEQMLRAGCSKDQRAALAQATGLAEETILELVQLSDLARLPGVKGIRARLYHSAGVRSMQAMAEQETETLLRVTAEFVERQHFPGIPPLPKEVSSTIETARRLPKVVEE
jgi:hypothetical protein